jgi:hypothetical protein
VLDSWIESRGELERRLRRFSRRLAGEISARVADSPGEVLRHHVEGADPDLLGRVARRVLERRPDAIVCLVGSDPESGEACFLVRAGPEGPEDVGDEGEALRAALGARGGGRGRLFQGAGGRLPGGGLEGYELF